MVMRAIDKKMLRDLWQMRGQAAAILMIIASGVALFVTMLAALESLTSTRDRYYADYRLADVFGACKRAPNSVASRIQEIDGVDVVETRVMAGATLDIEGLVETATAEFVSIPDGRSPRLNDLYLHAGRMPRQYSENEVVVIESFANANELGIGDSLVALINGRRKALHIVGIGLSPEYVYAIAPGGLYPDDRLYGIVWMNESSLAAAFDMDGAFNSVTIRLQRGASEADVIRRLDIVLEPYGGRGAIARADQQSVWFLEMELSGLSEFGLAIPIVFIGIAAFLLNVVSARLIKTQREQIAALKAFGYSNGQVAAHFGKLIGLIIAAGGVIGTAAGWMLGGYMIEMYKDYFQFPELQFHMSGWIPIAGIVCTASTTAIGTFSSIRRAATLPPAEAMRPEAPPLYRPTLLERIGLQRLFSQPTRMILRHLERRPLQSAMAVLGISFGVALMFVMNAMFGMLDRVVDIQKNVMHREDLEVTFREPRSRDALYEIAALPGVKYAEPFRSVAARLRYQHRDRLVAIRGIAGNSQLEQVLDRNLDPFTIPIDGVLISSVLADSLGIRTGDTLTIEVMEGAQPIREIRVVGLVDDYFGISAYMDLDALNRLMKSDSVLTSVKMTVEPSAEASVLAKLRERPGIASAATKGSAIRAIEEQVDDYLLAMIGMSMFFAGLISFGVIYNTARISLSERSRELASLRVLGLTRNEISYILLGELAILTVLALPLGFAIGHALLVVMIESVSSDVMRFPTVVYPSTYSLSVIAVGLAAFASAFVVRRKLNSLDLVEVLKTRD